MFDDGVVVTLDGGAILAGVAAVIAAIAGTGWRINRRVGKPNGKGNVVEMLEVVLDEQMKVRQEQERVAKELLRRADYDRRIEAKLDEFGNRFDEHLEWHDGLLGSVRSGRGV